jgi:hypothetical protein
VLGVLAADAGRALPPALGGGHVAGEEERIDRGVRGKENGLGAVDPYGFRAESGDEGQFFDRGRQCRVEKLDLSFSLGQG